MTSSSSSSVAPASINGPAVLPLLPGGGRRQSSTAVAAPRRPLVRDLNPYLVCGLCDGYLVDATTLTQCMHSFCRSCLMQYLRKCKTCPTCRDQFKTRIVTKFRRDRKLQTLVYKLVPGLFQDEVRRRKEFCSSARAGDGDTWRTQSKRRRVECDKMMAGIYTGHEYISVCLRHCDRLSSLTAIRRETRVSAGQDSEQDQRFLQCPANITIGHLKKYIMLKFAIDQNHQVEMFVQNECLEDDFSLIDVAYAFYSKKVPRMTLHYIVGDITNRPQQSPSLPTTPAISDRKLPAASQAGRRKLQRSSLTATPNGSGRASTSPPRGKRSRRKRSSSPSKIIATCPSPQFGNETDVNDTELIIETDRGESFRDGSVDERNDDSDRNELHNHISEDIASRGNNGIHNDNVECRSTYSAPDNSSECSHSAFSKDCQQQQQQPVVGGDDRLLSSFFDINLHEMISTSVSLSHLVDDSSCELSRNDLYNNNSVTSAQWLQKSFTPATSAISESILFADEASSAKTLRNVTDMSDASSDIDIEIRKIVANVTINSNQDDAHSMTDDCGDDDPCCSPAVSSPYQPDSGVLPATSIASTEPQSGRLDPTNPACSSTLCCQVPQLQSSMDVTNPFGAVFGIPPAIAEQTSHIPSQQFFVNPLSGCSGFSAGGEMFGSIGPAGTIIAGSGDVAYIWNAAATAACSQPDVLPCLSGSQLFYVETPQNSLVDMNSTSGDCSLAAQGSVTAIQSISDLPADLSSCSIVAGLPNSALRQEVVEIPERMASEKTSDDFNMLSTTAAILPSLDTTKKLNASVASDTCVDENILNTGDSQTAVNIVDSRSASPSQLVIDDVPAHSSCSSTTNNNNNNNCGNNSRSVSITQTATVCPIEATAAGTVTLDISCSSPRSSENQPGVPSCSSVSNNPAEASRASNSLPKSTSSSKFTAGDSSPSHPSKSTKSTLSCNKNVSNIDEFPAKKNELNNRELTSVSVTCTENAIAPKTSPLKVSDCVSTTTSGADLPSPMTADCIVPSSPSISAESSTAAAVSTQSTTERATVGTQTNDLLIDRYFRRRTNPVNSFLVGGKYSRGSGCSGVSGGVLKDRLSRNLPKTTTQTSTVTSHTAAYTFSSSTSSSVQSTANAVLFTPGQGTPVLMPAVTPLTINGKSTFLITLPANFTLPTTVSGNICPPTSIALPKTGNPVSTNAVATGSFMIRPGSIGSSAPVNGGRPSSVMLSQTYGTPIQLVVASASSSSLMPCITLGNRAQLKTSSVRQPVSISEASMPRGSLSSTLQPDRKLLSPVDHQTVSSQLENGGGIRRQTSTAVHQTSTAVSASSVIQLLTGGGINLNGSPLSVVSCSTATVPNQPGAPTTVFLVPMTAVSSSANTSEVSTPSIVASSFRPLGCSISPSTMSTVCSSPTFTTPCHQEPMAKASTVARHLTIANLPQVMQRKSSDHCLPNAVANRLVTSVNGPCKLPVTATPAATVFTPNGFGAKLPPLTSDPSLATTTTTKQPVHGEGAPVRLIRAILERNLTGPQYEQDYIRNSATPVSAADGNRVDPNGKFSTTCRGIDVGGECVSSGSIGRSSSLAVMSKSGSFSDLVAVDHPQAAGSARVNVNGRKSISPPVIGQVANFDQSGVAGQNVFVSSLPVSSAAVPRILHHRSQSVAAVETRSIQSPTNGPDAAAATAAAGAGARQFPARTISTAVSQSSPTAVKRRAAAAAASTTNSAAANGSASVKRRRATVDVLAANGVHVSGAKTGNHVLVGGPHNPSTPGTGSRGTSGSGRPNTVATMLRARNNSKKRDATAGNNPETTNPLAEWEPGAAGGGDTDQPTSLAKSPTTLTTVAMPSVSLLDIPTVGGTLRLTASETSGSGASVETQAGARPAAVSISNVDMISRQLQQPTCTVATALVGRSTLQSAARSVGAVALPKKLYAYLGSAMSHEHIAAVRENAAATAGNVNSPGGSSSSSAASTPSPSATSPALPAASVGADAAGIGRRPSSGDLMATEDGPQKRRTAADEGPIRHLRMMCSGLTYSNGNVELSSRP